MTPVQTGKGALVTIVIGLITGLALLFYSAYLFCNLLIPPEADPAYSGAFLFLIWPLLGIALLMVGIRRVIPLWSLLVALPLMPLSFVLLATSITAVPDLWKAHYPVQWLVAVHAVAPVPIFVYIGWVSIPPLHRLVSPNRASAIAWGAVFVLAMLTTITWPKMNDIARERQNEVTRNLRARFEKVPLDAPLRDWMEYLDCDSIEVQNDAVQRVRGLHNKQSEVEKALQGNYSYGFFTHLYQFELSPTPVLCESARRWLTEKSIALRPESGWGKYAPIRPGGPADKTPLAACLPTLRWLAGNRCPLLDELNTLEITLRAYRRGSENEPFFHELDEIKLMLPKK
jgi:hypothetical protein